MASMLCVRWGESFCQKLAVEASEPVTGRWSSSQNIPSRAQRVRRQDFNIPAARQGNEERIAASTPSSSSPCNF
ncbi:hypothetical protein T4A_9489 [Trichinella pseudospiralis]|uniref:Uncharacterized protein n=1 Tax=Trichinella pseudospiralis TaxID=6337 RepID=A0A0V1EEY2_TRIPS|nr:hypothetical protein T4A_9489 [Trichinella pseudospiralis]